jgi:arylsulfatase A-like enzyme
VRTSRWKYIHYTELADSDELYDLQADPYEMDNVIAKRGAPVVEMHQRLRQLLKETSA